MRSFLVRGRMLMLVYPDSIVEFASKERPNRVNESSFGLVLIKTPLIGGGRAEAGGDSICAANANSAEAQVDEEV